MSDPILFLSNSQSPVFLLNSRLGRFTAASTTRRQCWRPFSRSYGAILPSSLATIHSSALGYSPRLPVSVYGTGCIYLKLRGFSWKYALEPLSPCRHGSVYYRASAPQRICLLVQRLHASTSNSVSRQVFGFFVTPSQYIQVREY